MFPFEITAGCPEAEEAKTDAERQSITARIDAAVMRMVFFKKSHSFL